MNGRLMTVTETGRFLGLSRWSVQAMVRSGALPFIPLGKKHKRIDRLDAEKWIQSRKVSNGAEFVRATDRRRK